MLRDLYGSFNDGNQTLGFIHRNGNVVFNDGRKGNVVVIHAHYDILTDQTTTEYDLCIAGKELDHRFRVVF